MRAISVGSQKTSFAESRKSASIKEVFSEQCHGNISAMEPLNIYSNLIFERCELYILMSLSPFVLLISSIIIGSIPS